MKKTDPLYKIAAIIAAVAVLVAAFSAIFIHGGEIGLPGGDRETLSSADAPERSASARRERSAAGDGKEDSEEDAAASPSPSPTATASPTPSPTPYSPPAELHETLPGVFEKLLELSQADRADYAGLGMEKQPTRSDAMSDVYYGSPVFGGHEWWFSASVDKPLGEEHPQSYYAYYFMDPFDPDLMSEAAVACYEELEARYGEPETVAVFTDNYDDIFYETEGGYTSEHAARMFHEDDENTYSSVTWEVYFGDVPAEVNLHFNRYEAESSIQVNILLPPGAKKQGAAQAQPSPSTSTAPAPAVPSGVGGTISTVYEYLADYAGNGTADEFIDAGLTNESEGTYGTTYSTRVEIGGYRWDVSAYLSEGRYPDVDMEHDSSDGHEAAAKAFADVYAFFTDMYGPHDYLGYEEDDGYDLTLDDVLQWFEPNESYFIMADWAFEDGGRTKRASLTAYLEEDGSFSIIIGI